MFLLYSPSGIKVSSLCDQMCIFVVFVHRRWGTTTLWLWHSGHSRIQPLSFARLAHCPNWITNNAACLRFPLNSLIMTYIVYQDFKVIYAFLSHLTFRQSFEVVGCLLFFIDRRLHSSSLKSSYQRSQNFFWFSFYLFIF